MESKEKILLRKANEFYDKKNYQNSITTFEELLKIDKSNPDYFEKIGMCYFHSRNLILCLKNLNKAQKLDPNNPFRYSSRAFVKNGMGDVDGAIEDYNIAIHLDPQDAIAHNNLGLLQEKIGFDKQAKSSYKKADDLAVDFFENKANDSFKNGHKKPDETPSYLTEDERKSTLSTIKNVFISRNGFKEFLKFLKNGFKLN
jgi:tetratricopeptide (TPR) repeat protein